MSGKPKYALVGTKQGRLTVICYSHSIGKKYYYYCVCDCGGEKIIRADSIKPTGTQSCGCLAKEAARSLLSTHGKSKIFGYTSWENMIARCKIENKKLHPYHAGKGIIVCERWANSPGAFFEDMGPKPSKKHSIERIDSDKGYYKENCIWATPRQQVYNSRSTKNGMPIGVIKRESKTKGSRFRVEVRINSKRHYLGIYDTELEAATAYDNKCEEFGEGRPNNTERKEYE